MKFKIISTSKKEFDYIEIKTETNADASVYDELETIFCRSSFDRQKLDNILLKKPLFQSNFHDKIMGLLNQNDEDDISIKIIISGNDDFFPADIMKTGNTYYGLKYKISYETENNISSINNHEIKNICRMAMISDPAGKSKITAFESEELLDFLSFYCKSRKLNIKIDYFANSITSNEFINILSQYDIVHFSGTTSSDKMGRFGLDFGKYVFTEISSDIQKRPMLFFLNACGRASTQSGTASINHSLIRNLGQTVIVPSIRIPDNNKQMELGKFYKSFFTGSAVWYALKKVRISGFNEKHPEFLLYHIFGNPDAAIREN